MLTEYTYRAGKYYHTACLPMDARFKAHGSTPTIATLFGKNTPTGPFGATPSNLTNHSPFGSSHPAQSSLFNRAASPHGISSLHHSSLVPAQPVPSELPKRKGFNEYLAEKTDLWVMLGDPALDVNHLFETGLSIRLISNYRTKGGPVTIQRFVERGLTLAKVIEECEKEARDSASSSGWFGMGGWFQGGASNTTGSTTFDPRNYSFTQADWRVMGANGPSDLNIPESIWHSLPVG